MKTFPYPVSVCVSDVPRDRLSVRRVPEFPRNLRLSDLVQRLSQRSGEAPFVARGWEELHTTEMGDISGI